MRGPAGKVARRKAPERPLNRQSRTVEQKDRRTEGGRHAGVCRLFAVLFVGKRLARGESAGECARGYGCAGGGMQVCRRGRAVRRETRGDRKASAHLRGADGYAAGWQVRRRTAVVWRESRGDKKESRHAFARVRRVRCGLAGAPQNCGCAAGNPGRQKSRRAFARTRRVRCGLTGTSVRAAAFRPVPGNTRRRKLTVCAADAARNRRSPAQNRRRQALFRRARRPRCGSGSRGPQSKPQRARRCLRRWRCAPSRRKRAL